MNQKFEYVIYPIVALMMINKSLIINVPQMSPRYKLDLREPQQVKAAGRQNRDFV